MYWMLIKMNNSWIGFNITDMWIDFLILHNKINIIVWLWKPVEKTFCRYNFHVQQNPTKLKDSSHFERLLRLQIFKYIFLTFKLSSLLHWHALSLCSLCHGLRLAFRVSFSLFLPHFCFELWACFISTNIVLQVVIGDAAEHMVCFSSPLLLNYTCTWVGDCLLCLIMCGFTGLI